ncbi:MAG: DUF3883 domain-containing protein, partial [Anaerolineae bacterium]|nr:DUF3883 domain-containing protein [Anaerolineae bacterium]
IIERYLRESFDVLIARSDGLLMGYEHKQTQGKDMRIKITEEERRNSDLRRRKDERLARAEREQVISLEEPRILGVAATLPAGEVQPRPGGSTSMRRDDEVERAAIAFVLAYETDQGRDAEDLSEQKLPYDIISREAGGDIRYIEVKGRAGIGVVELGEREWLTAENLGESYWLYAVMNATTRPRLHILRDPVHNLSPDSVVKHTRYRVSPSGWQDTRNNE